MAVTISDIRHAVAEYVDQVFRQIEADIALLEPPDMGNNFPADRSMEGKFKILKLSHVVVAAHLATAKVVFRVVPTFWIALLKEAIIDVGGPFLAKMIAKTAAKKLPGIGDLGAMLGGIAAEEQRGNRAKEYERQIRAVFAEARKDLNIGSPMKQTKQKGRVRDVLTRRYTRPKRNAREGCKSR